MLLGLWSCSDESLTEINPNNPIVSWNSLGDTQKGLNSVYNSLLNESILSIEEEAWRSDMGYPGFGRPVANTTSNLPAYNLTYTNGQEFINDKWNACYTTIYYANQVIEGLNSLLPVDPVELELWESQMGQARFIRGLMHFYLHSTFNNGEIIIRDKVPTVSTGFGKALSSSDEVTKFFREDLEYAYEKLPEEYDDNFLGSATKWAAATILGTSYLYEASNGPNATGDYVKPTTYFEAVINSGKYSIVTDLSLMFTKEGEFNQESIFELAYNNQYRLDFTVWQSGKLSHQLSHQSTANTGFFMPAWVINAYKNDEMDTADARNIYTEPDGSTTQKPVSLRTSIMTAIINDDLSFFGDKRTADAIRTSTNGWGFGYYRKYIEFENTDPRGTRSAGSNVVVNRLAEVYLMQAECLIQQNDIAGALKLINEIRNRWALVLLGQPDGEWPAATFDNVVYDKASLMDRLMYIEKPLELSVEGHATRWIDLRRWGIIDDNLDRLSNAVYYAEAYSYPARDPITGEKTGATTTKNNSSIVDVDPGASGLNVIDYEYDEARTNYNSSLHDYYPIPLNEILRNPLLN